MFARFPSARRLFYAVGLLVAGGTGPLFAQSTFPEMQALKPRLESYPALSPDGQYLVYTSGVGFALNLYRLDLESDEVVQLTDNEFEDSAAAWSPDGKSLVFQREDEQGNRDVWEIDAEGTAERNLTRTPDIREQHPRYGPGGTTIVFDSNRAETAPDGGADGIQNYEIYGMALDADSLWRMTTSDRWDMYPSLSPDANRLVWRRALPVDTPDEQNFEVFVKDLTTGEETNLTNHEALDTNPHWSPLGNWIVFASNRTGAFELFVIRPDGSGLRQVTNSGGAGLGYGRPSFTGDGMRIVANRFVRGVTDMVIIDFPGNPDDEARQP